MSKRLQWGERLALMDHYGVGDEEACEVFGIEQEELEAARDMQTVSKAFPVRDDLDVESYRNLFSGNTVTAAKKPTTAKSITSKTTSTKKSSTTTTIRKPETATKKTPIKKKRGRNGDKIVNAFRAIPHDQPTDAEKFAKTHHVSIAVLRQSKRFDKVGGGIVHVKKDKATKTLMIWRDTVSS